MRTKRSQVSGRASQPERFALRNNFGFWELTFNGQSFVVPQHQALFYVAWLLANPAPVPISAQTLAANVFYQFGCHDDFDLSLPWVSLKDDDQRAAAVLARKQQKLTAILAREDLIDVIRNEAERELSVVEQFQSALHCEIAKASNEFAEALSAGLRHLHFNLATAIDRHGDPHPVLRPFALHLLVYLIMPSNKTTLGGLPPCFIYSPPEGVTWSE